MSLVTVQYIAKTKPSKEKVKEDLRWYDIIKQEMQYFKGGKLIFHYTEYTKLVVSKKIFQDPEWNIPILKNLYEKIVPTEELDAEIKRAFQYERIKKLERINGNNN